MKPSCVRLSITKGLGLVSAMGWETDIAQLAVDHHPVVLVSRAANLEDLGTRYERLGAAERRLNWESEN